MNGPVQWTLNGPIILSSHSTWAVALANVIFVGCASSSIAWSTHFGHYFWALHH